MEDKQILETLQRIENTTKDRLQELGDANDALATEVRERGGTSPETKEKIETLEGELKNLSDAYEELKELAPQIREMKSEMERPGARTKKGRTTPGTRFSESEEYKSWKDNNENKSKAMELGSIDNMLESKALTSDEGVWGGLGLFIEPMLLPGILQDPQRQLRFRDLVNVQQVGTDSVRYFRETGFANLYAVLSANAAIAATVITLDATGTNTGVSGFFAGQTIVVGGETRVIATGGVNSATNQLTLTTGLTAAKTAGTEVISDHLAGTPHGGLKPQSSIIFDDEVAQIITLAHWIAAHRQTLEDAPQLQNYVNQRLLFGLDLALENQAMYGTGTSTTLLGIFNQPGVQDQGTRAGNDANGNPFTHIDWLRKALTKAMVAEYPVNGIMVNPLDWESIEMAKDTQGRYLMMSITEGGVRRLFGIPVVVSTAIRAGEFLTGAFGLGATLFDRQKANIRIADQHADFFVRNAVAILAELRVGLALTRPEAFIKGKF